ncbi:MAG: EF-P lysine aminoacylase GenX [Candidatus Altimarinota bacterium]
MQNWQAIRDGKLEKETFIQRARILDLIREWFRKEGFLEVETPLMVKHPGMEPHLNLFSSQFVSEDGQYSDKRYLHTSPEYSMKKLLGAGFDKIFQLTKVFRNGELGNADFLGCTGGKAGEVNYCVQPLGENESRHNPEFTMLEWYRGNAGYENIMDDCESMFKYIVQYLPREAVPTSIRQLVEGEWERLSVKEAFQRYAGLDLDSLREEKDLRAAVEKKGYELGVHYTWDDLFFLILLNEIEPHLGKEKPQFLIDYPASQAALARKKADDPFYAERFELYINGLELCNAFGELVDPVEQRKRLEEEWQQRKDMGKETYPLDEMFLEALKTMPPSGGNALGIDRLVMVLLGKKSIEEVLLFPWGDVS